MTAAYILMQLNTPDPREIMESVHAVARYDRKIWCKSSIGLL